MKIKLGINGFGRIGRGVLRALYQHSDRESLIVTHINDLSTPQQAAHLLKYDSVHGRFPLTVEAGEDFIAIEGQKIAFTNCREPRAIAWQSVQTVLECSGVFRKREDVEQHLHAGAQKVIISAPASGEDLTVVYGINSSQLDPQKHRIISNGSCTTNCLAPLLLVIHRQLGVARGLMTTVHSYTGDQRILDLAHKDMRRSRAAAANIIPTTTGAARAIGLVIPSLQGKIDGISVRVPTPNVSLVDAVLEVERDTTVEEINSLFIAASETDLCGVLACSNEPLVSSDYLGSHASSIVDLQCTAVMQHRMVKVLAWYDNETGFCHRLLDIAKLSAGNI